MDTIQHNPARLYSYDETGVTVVQHKHMKILGLKGKCQISSVQSAEWGSLFTVVTCMSPTGHFSPPLLVFPIKKYETRTDEWHTAWLNPHLPSLRVGTERDFFPVVSSFHQTYKANRRRSFYLSTGWAFSHTRNPEVITLAPEDHVDITCFPPHSSYKMQRLDKAFIEPLKTFYCQETEKWLCSQPGQVVTIYQTGELFGNAYKQAATGETVTNGFWATGKFLCDINIFRPYVFPLSSEDTHAAPVNHPALGNTSNQPSSSSANFSQFTSAVPLRSSDISSVPSLNLKPNPRGGTAKLNNEFTLQKICSGNSRKENQRDH
jgi:hypothetical protein